MAKIPNKLIFEFIDKVSSEPVNELVILLKLFAHRKNDYYIGPKFTNQNGKVEFTFQECLDEIQVSRKMFPMDYKSSLQECLSKISIEVMSQDGIQKLIESRREYKDLFKKVSDCSENFFKRLVASNNRLYQPVLLEFSEDLLKEQETIEIYVALLQ